MATIKAFRGYRFNKEIVGDLGLVMAPPYDAISPYSEDKFYELSEYNAVRLITTGPNKKKLHPDEKYSGPAKVLSDWIAKGVLLQDKDDSIYLYEQTITLNGESHSNRGFISLLKLVDYSNGEVIPCEEPTTNSKKERFELTKRSQSNNSLISCMYVDPEKELENLMVDVSDDEPTMEFYLEDGIRQRLWQITDKAKIDKITKFMEDKVIYIVDGHNRYEACLEYRNYEKEHNKKYTLESDCNYTLVQLSEAHEDGRTQLPVHRLVKLPNGFKEEYFVSSVQDRFKIERIIVDASEDNIADIMSAQIATQRSQTRFAVYCGKDYFYRLTLKDPDSMKEILPDASDTYRRLDLVVLNKLVLDKILKINDNNSDELLEYTKDVNEGVNAVKGGEYDCLFVVNPIRSRTVSTIALSGEKLPKRSLSVFPKPATGIVINKFSK